MKMSFWTLPILSLLLSSFRGFQSECTGSVGDADIGSLISTSAFDNLLKHRNDAGCQAKGFYTFDAFMAAAKSFPGFATTGDTDTRKREIAAFLAQTSHETTGGWESAPDGPFSWGYCYLKEQNPGSYCSSDKTYPCASGKQYFGRGPIQISWNYNYGRCGKAIGVDLLNNPDLVSTDAVISFKTAIWFWMTPQSPKPSCHDVITGKWKPTDADKSAGRNAGYGLITNIINGGLECGKGKNPKVESRIGFYKRYCDILKVGYGDNLDCYKQKPFGNIALLEDTGSVGDADIGSLISTSAFDKLLKHRNDAGCQAKGFYTFDAFIAAAKSFSGFATTGDTDTRKREIAAFLAQTSHETTGGWESAPDGPYAWGYCYLKEQNPGSYCLSDKTYPCASGKQYYGRGPIQISWNYNYGRCGKAIGVDLLNHPDRVSTDAVISFKTAIWFWMTPQSPKPSCHDVITGKWKPSDADKSAGRKAGYGLITNIINGGLECGKGKNPKVESRIGFYKRYCDILKVGYGDNLDCYKQKPFGNIALLVDTM